MTLLSLITIHTKSKKAEAHYKLEKPVSSPERGWIPQKKPSKVYGAFAKYGLLYPILLCIAFPLMKLHKELVGASSAIIVLSILSKGDTYGYAIIQRVRELSSGKIEWTDGMLYPVLHWLRKHGQIGSRWLVSKTGRRRCYYSLRAKGRKTLRDLKQQWKLVSSTLDRLWQTQGPDEMPPRKEIRDDGHSG